MGAFVLRTTGAAEGDDDGAAVAAIGADVALIGARIGAATTGDLTGEGDFCDCACGDGVGGAFVEGAFGATGEVECGRGAAVFMLILKP